MSIKIIEKYVEEVKLALNSIDMNVIDEAVNVLWDAYQNDRQVFIFGNGGSASTASHMACDIGKGVVQVGNDSVYKAYVIM